DQLSHHRCCLAQLGQVDSQGADVSAGPTANGQVDVWILVSPNLDLVDLHDSARHFHFNPTMSKLIGFPAVDLDRRMSRRDLCDLANKLCSGGCDRFTAGLWRIRMIDKRRF